MTWDSIEAISELNEYYCQLSVIHYNKDDGEYLLLSNPNVSGRYDGWVHLGKVNEDGSISWDHAQQINEGKFQYSCLTVLENDGENPVFGLMYEDDTDGSFDIKYTEFDENFVKAPLISEKLGAPQIVDSSAQIDGTDITVTLTFDQDIMAAGTPKLELTLGSETFAADYAGGSGTETITFKGTLPEGVKGIVRAAGISLENGLLEKHPQQERGGRESAGWLISRALRSRKASAFMITLRSSHPAPRRILMAPRSMSSMAMYGLTGIRYGATLLISCHST